MTRYLLAGGGTAGHVNPLLAVAQRIRETEADAVVTVVGTAEGLESRLVPEAGFELVTIPKVPFPRRPNRAALAFPARFRAAQRAVAELLRDRTIDVVVGFGGYAATPAYLAARAGGVPIVVHEANAKPGLANRLGARLTRWVGVVFPGTPLPNARLVGMPLRPAIEVLAREPGERERLRAEATRLFNLPADRPVLLVTGGSLGARRINATVRASAAKLVARGWNVLHLVGGTPDVDDPGVPGYRQVPYLDRMELALAAAELVISRSGAGAVSELTALAIPTVYVPYAVGNGEQRRNALRVVEAGGAVIVNDADFTESAIDGVVASLMADETRREAMRTAASGLAIVDGTARTLSLIHAALA